MVILPCQFTIISCIHDHAQEQSARTNQIYLGGAALTRHRLQVTATLERKHKTLKHTTCAGYAEARNVLSYFAIAYSPFGLAKAKALHCGGAMSLICNHESKAHHSDR